MTTIKSYTDLEQSKKLVEILSLESADMYYFLDPTPAGNIYHLVVQKVDIGTKNLPQYNEGDIPCWSLLALLGVLPNASILLKGFDKIYDLTNSSGEITRADNPVDACVDMILKLHELNLL